MEQKWLVYILRCADDTLYTGITDDIDRRIEQHNAGKGAKYTRGRGPVCICYLEKCENKGAALRREHEIKSMSREKKLSMINDCLE